MSKEPNRNVYIGHRYVPLLVGEWDNSIEYEGLSIVTHKGASYTSKKRVPVGIDIENEEFWVVTGNYNAQVEYYRDETKRVSEELKEKINRNELEEFQSIINDDFNEYKDGLNDDIEIFKDNTNETLNLKVSKDELVINGIDHGVIGDGVNDDTNIINNLLNEYTEVYLPNNKEYLISDTLRIPRGKRLYSSGTKPVIKMTTINKPVIEQEHLSLFENFTIEMARNNTNDNACGVKWLLSSETSRPETKNIDFIGLDRTSNGLYIDGDSGNLSFGLIENVYFERVINAIKVDTIQTSAVYANGIIGNNIIIRSSVRGFHINSDGNIFTNIQWNSSPATEEVIHCSGYYNTFSGWYWDLRDGANPYVLATYDGNASVNMIKSPGNLGSWIVNDKTDNKINYVNISTSEITSKVHELSHLPQINMNIHQMREWGRWYNKKPYGGPQDNFLAFADKIHDVTSVGKAHKDGTLANIFNPFAGISGGKPTWNLNTGENITINIDINKPTFSNKRLDFLQVVFSSGLEAENIFVEAYNGNNWVELININDNKKRFVTFHDEISALVVGPDITSIRVVISNPLNGSRDIRIESISGRLLATSGYSFLGKNGGNIYGNLEFENGDGLIMTSPNGTRWKMRINDDGVMSWIELQ